MIRLSLFSVLAICFFSCNNQPTNNQQSSAIHVVDIRGNEIKLNKPAEKIVCLFDPSVDVIYMLQAQDKLVGIPAETYFDAELYDYYKQIDSRILNKNLPTPGSNEVANVESIVHLNPDLVIAQQLPESAIKTLQSMDIPVYITSSNKYDELIKEMKDISILTGKEERGKELIEYVEHKVKELQEQADLDSDKQHKSAYFTWANGKIFSTTGRNSMMNDCLELAGVDNACPSEIDKPNINPETLIEWNPDMIVMWNDSPDLFYNKKELCEVKAIKTKKIHNLVPMFFYNPHTFKSICAAMAINGWAYGKKQENIKSDIKEALLVLYGQENGNKLIKQL